MRNIPFAFLDEETIDQISRADREHINGFTNLAETQKSMRGVITRRKDREQFGVMAAVKRITTRFIAGLERMMVMSGPNSIANLERALRTQNDSHRRSE